jgi:hypothetical protein
MKPTRWTALLTTAATLALTATLARAQNTTTPTEKKPAPKAIAPATVQPTTKPATTPTPTISKPMTTNPTVPAQPGTKTTTGPTPDELRAQWEKANQPGPMHKKLEPLAGTFVAHAKFFTPGTTEPQESTGTSVQKWILGGRFLQQEFSGSMMGKPFTGVGYFGYDNASKRYSGTWMSTMTTSLQVQTGTVDDSGKVFTMVSTYKDANTGQEHDNRSVVTIIDNDNNKYETFENGPDGKEYKVLEVTYARTK